MRARILLSTLGGMLFGLGSFLVVALLQLDRPLLLGTICGIFFGLLLFTYLATQQYFAHRRYEALKKALPSPVFFQASGNYHMEGKVRSGTAYFCEDSVVLVFMDERPYVKNTIPRDTIDHISHAATQLTVCTKAGKTISLSMADTQPLVDILRKKGWLEQ